MAFPRGDHSTRAGFSEEWWESDLSASISGNRRRMKPSAIITGSNGQDGVYLQQLLERENVDPILVHRMSGIDLADEEVVKSLISNTRPDYIFHFAASSTV